MAADHRHQPRPAAPSAGWALACLATILTSALACPQLVGGTARALAPGAQEDGPSGRYSLDGQWLFRREARPNAHIARALPRSSTLKGWSYVDVPSAWNAKLGSDPQMKGTVGWYRKDFALPSTDPHSAWIVRFQSVNNHVQVWLNGTSLGSHAGPYIPFQLVLPGRLINRRGVNRLVVRVDDHRLRGDLPEVNYWWNFGGILRPVELERINRVGFSSVQFLPQLACATCPATIEYRVAVRNYSEEPQPTHVRATYGPSRLDLGAATLPPRRTHVFTGSLTLATPRLWWPQSPYLYPVRLTVSGPAGHTVRQVTLASYSLHSGVRSIGVAPDGTLRLNGQLLNMRGVGLIEDSLELGGALDYAHEAQLISEAKELGATAIRSQYPLDERLEEMADSQGILLWSEIPVDKVPPDVLAHRAFRMKAVEELEQNILTNSNHPSIIVWSIANELDARPDAAQSAYIAQATHTAHALDPTRPVGLAVAAYPSAGCQAADYAPLDVIGLNDYFGWYPGPHGELADRNGLSSFLDAMRACYPTKGLLVTEFGAEANREGPVTEPGTYAFQQDFVKFHLETFATKPWLAGAFYWALREFRVRPGWGGGNPKPSPPIHTKGLISIRGFHKPAFFEAQRLYRLIEELHAPPS